DEPSALKICFIAYQQRDIADRNRKIYFARTALAACIKGQRDRGLQPGVQRIDLTSLALCVMEGYDNSVRAAKSRGRLMGVAIIPIYA
ncbi:hypothetical protein, partial [Salmonella sp. SAL4433]|uniref:hypothetical protein n=1 Tax=Salmonella sp. SAL4433 TaxID=3159888 RepID=UPI00397DF4CA